MRMTNEEWLNSLSEEQRKEVENLRNRDYLGKGFIDVGLPIPDFVNLYRFF